MSATSMSATTDTTTTDAPHVRRFDVREYYQMADEACILHPREHVELLDGIVYHKYTGERRRYTASDARHMVQRGVLHPRERLELIDGQLYVMAPAGSRHVACVNRLTDAFTDQKTDAFLVSVQNPVALGPEQQPAPDVALLRRRPGYDAGLPGPGDVLLLVEVADTSLRFDRETKLPLYAAHGIPEVWIVNLAGDVVETYRDPAPDGFRAARTHERGSTLAPASVPDLALAVDALLGPAPSA